MKTQPPANLCAIPLPYGAQLTALAPSIAFNVSRTLDANYRWDGDGEDPTENGFNAYDIDVTARAIVRGQIVKGSAHLGGSYFREDEPTGDIHGYLLQMLDEAMAELLPALGVRNANDLAAQCAAVRNYLRETMRAEYAAQRAAHA